MAQLSCGSVQLDPRVVSAELGRAARWQQAWQACHDFLSSEQRDGHWSGQLSTSALSTATAISALAQVRQHVALDNSTLATVDDAISIGSRWLIDAQNSDGGFGDTDRSHSNIATTLLAMAAWKMAVESPVARLNSSHRLDQIPERTAIGWQYVEREGKWRGLAERYGKDKTFVVPILSNCALAGLVPWTDVSALPFELAWLPQDYYRWARMPVVSYAIPALVAIGQARFHKAPPTNPVVRLMRRRAVQPTLRVLREMQPASGGYLEAVPLTSFVLMNLSHIGLGHLPVCRDSLRFILDSRLHDGSWPIDINLATWVTSLSCHAIARRKPIELHSRQKPADATDATAEHGGCTSAEKLVRQNRTLITEDTLRWLLSCQHQRRHPFTGANPGGWGWTDLSGAVPDADDTPAALLAIRAVDWSKAPSIRLQHQALIAVGMGLKWLLRLQNRDGGWPTFCRGWGKLPFDRSGSDLTAHALRALHAWRPGTVSFVQLGQEGLPPSPQVERAIARGLRYLQRTQKSDGSWEPLWFGNQDRPSEENPTYGTGKVLLAYGALDLVATAAAQRGIEFLRRSQNRDGGWGGGASVAYPQGQRSVDHGEEIVATIPQARPPARASTSTIEETAVALEGLITCGGNSRQDATIMQGLDWLAETICRGNLDCSWPIGFYFAKLWYYERLYPAIFSLGALGAALNQIESEVPKETPTLPAG